VTQCWCSDLLVTTSFCCLSDVQTARWDTGPMLQVLVRLMLVLLCMCSLELCVPWDT
jgi:hypothetical protein